LIYTGYIITRKDFEKLTNTYGIILIVLGILPVLYHAHLAYTLS